MVTCFLVVFFTILVSTEIAEFVVNLREREKVRKISLYWR